MSSLSIATSSGTTGFTWVVDRKDCEGVLEITNGFIFNQPIDGDSKSELLIQNGLVEELFTLFAIAEGSCTFRMAYARPSETAFSFSEYQKSGGLVIQIPIQIGELSEEEVRQLEYGLTQRAEKHFKLMGAQAWMRSFLTPSGLFVWLPQAIIWQRAKDGNLRAAQRFVSVTMFWAQIGGWIFFFLVLLTSGLLIYPGLLAGFVSDDSSDSGYCQNTNYGYWGNVLRDQYGDPCSDYNETNAGYWCGNYDTQ